ncbi:MAG: PEGA domain-containing protein [bacterium]|nr:PEGA domain-containing protein [bacterium]
MKRERRGVQAAVLSVLILILAATVFFQIYSYLKTAGEVRTVYLPNNEEKPFLFINSSPQGVQVKINDSIIVQTPQVISLDKGSFMLTTFSDEFERRDTLLTLLTNDTVFFEMKRKVLVEEWGYLSVNASPWADVYVNEQLYDRTPIDENIKLKSGRYTLLLKHPNRKDYRKEISIEKDSILRISVELEKAYGFLKIVVRPWADVFIDGQLLGTTPLSDSLQLLTGPHSIRLVNSNYPAIEDEIIISEEEVLRKFYSF